MPHLSYVILAWGTCSKSVYKLQKKAVRVITNSHFIAHTEPLFKKLSILKLDDIFKLQVLKFYFNYRHNSVPIYFQLFDFVSRSETHHYDTRNKEKLSTTKTRTKIADLSLRHITCSVVNDTSSSIIDKIYTHSYQG